MGGPAEPKITAMPLFYFHLRTPTGLDPDEIGLEYSDLERAYLEACRTVPEMAVDLVRRGRSPMSHAFEITDAAGSLLLEVPFGEVLQDGRKPRRPPLPSVADRTVSAVTRAQELSVSLHEQVERLRAQMRRSQDILASRRPVGPGCTLP